MICSKCYCPLSDGVLCCEQCGQSVAAPVNLQKAGLPPIVWVLLVFVGLMGVTAGLLIVGGRFASPKTQTVKAIAHDSPAPVSSPVTSTSAWEYRTFPDPMSKGAVSTATVSSTTPLNFGFPYGGEQFMRLAIWQHPRHGLNVTLSIDRGQFLCSTYQCELLVRFDDEKAVRFSGTEPADNSTTTVFINSPARFVAGLRKAKKVFIQPTFYHEGNPVVEFDVSGLKW